jgi:hypothetical protein
MTRPQDIERDTLEAATARRFIAANRPPLLDTCRYCRQAPDASSVPIWNGGFVHGHCWPVYATRTFYAAADRARRSLGLPEF